MRRGVKHQCSLQLDEATQMEDSDSSNQIFIKPEHMDVRTSIAEIEHELEDVLLNTILNHEVFVRNIPLNIEITVKKKIKTEVESQNKEINVKLHLDPDIRHNLTNDKKGVIQNSDEIKEVLSSQKEYFEKAERRVSKQAESTSVELKPRIQDSETSNVGTLGNVALKQVKKFTLEQDKEILDKVVILLPGKSLANLELSEDVLNFLSAKFARSPSSIQQRWKYSLRTWLVQFFSKNHRSWSKNLSAKASVERRKQIVKYFNKLVKKNTLKIEVMNATKII